MLETLRRSKEGEAPRERRGRPRSEVSLDARWMLLQTVRVVDLSASGACVEAERAFEFCNGSLDLGLERGGAPMVLRARVVWCRLVRTERGPFGEVCPKFRAGLKLDFVEEEPSLRATGSAGARPAEEPAEGAPRC